MTGPSPFCFFSEGVRVWGFLWLGLEKEAEPAMSDLIV